VYGFDGGLALIEPGPPMTLTISTEAAVLRAIPSVGEPKDTAEHA
jgi:hypothetical protein